MAADAPFVARPVGDEAAARVLAERVAHDVGAPAPVLLRTAMNATYRAGGLVIRVGRPTGPAGAAYELADVLAAIGVRVPAPGQSRPVVTGADGLAATAWEHVGDGSPVDWQAVGAMVARLHGLAPARVPESYPVPFGSSFPWWQFDSMLGRARPLVDDGAFRALAAAVERGAWWPTGSGGPEQWVLCHGDVHPANVVSGPDGPVLLDWDLLCLAPPGWDHGPLRSMIARWGTDAAAYDAFAAGYGVDLSADPVTVALTELRLVAATLMLVLAEGPDRAPDGEAERRLGFWRGDPSAPVWRVI